MWRQRHLRGRYRMTYSRCRGQLKVGQGLVRVWTQAACAAEVLTCAMQYRMVQGHAMGCKGDVWREEVRSEVSAVSAPGWQTRSRANFKPMSQGWQPGVGIPGQGRVCEEGTSCSWFAAAGTKNTTVQLRGKMMEGLEAV